MIVNMILEGLLEEPVARKLISFCGHIAGSAHRLGGASKIKTRSHLYHSMTSYGEAVLVLSDAMDTGEACIPQAKYEYLTKHIAHPNPNFLLRFADRELESWLIADGRGLARFFQIPITRVPTTPDVLPDPKQTIISLARLSRTKAIRERMVPGARHEGPVGPDYTGTMSQFVGTHWDISQAASKSPSLHRCIRALKSIR